MSQKKILHISNTLSTQKTTSGINLKDKLGKLTEAVNELRLNAEQEAQQQESLEQINSKNYVALNVQIKALRKMFNTLIDAVAEEIDNLKLDIIKERQEGGHIQNKRYDDLDKSIYKLQNIIHNDKITFEEEIKNKLNSIEEKQIRQYEYFQQLIDSLKDDNKIMLEKLKIVVSSNTSQIEIITNQLEKLQKNLMNKSSNDEAKALKTETLVELTNKMIELEDYTKFIHEDLVIKLDEKERIHEKYKDDIKNNIKNTIQAHNDNIRKYEEINFKLNKRLDNLEVFNTKNMFELENIVKQIQNEFQENLNEFGKIHKETSHQIISDFENIISSLNKEITLLHKKVNSYENNLSKYKEEFISILAEQEYTFKSKTEQLNKAIFDICCDLNISNPLILD